MNNLIQESPQEATQANDLCAHWIFVARAISIYLIVWMHTDISPSFVPTIVQGATGTFFLIAGYYLPRTAKGASFFALISARTWLIWTIIATALYAILKGPIDWQDAIGWHIQSYNYPLWYLRTILVYQFVLAAFMLVGLMPKHSVLITILLAGMAYLTQWSDLSAINFAWFVTMLVGYSLHAIPIEKIYSYLKKYRYLIACSCIIFIVQGITIPAIGAAYDWSFKPANISITSISYSVLVLLLASLILEKFPKASTYIAKIGSCSMFIFVSHAILNGILHIIQAHISIELHLFNPATPLLTLVFSSIVCLWLRKQFPRVMEFVGCP